MSTKITLDRPPQYRPAVPELSICTGKNALYNQTANDAIPAEIRGSPLSVIAQNRSRTFMMSIGLRNELLERGEFDNSPGSVIFTFPRRRRPCEPDRFSTRMGFDAKDSLSQL